MGAESKLGFLDSLVGLFRGAPEPSVEPSSAPAAGGFEALRTGFEATLRELDQKAEELRRESGAPPSAAGASPRSEEERAAERVAERARRMEAARAAIREDIAGAHTRLGTGLEKTDLEALARDLEELSALAESGRDSHELLSRARFTIAERVLKETGELAVARLVALLQRAGQAWPDPTHYAPTAKPEEVERSRRRRLAETRDAFLAQDLSRTAKRLLGVVEVWGSDYPDRGTPLWEETVLEGLSAGIRGDLVRQSVEILRAHRDELLAGTEASVGKELAALRQVLQSGVASLEQANLATASALRVLDEVVPEVAWKTIRSRLPAARGEWGS